MDEYNKPVGAPKFYTFKQLTDELPDIYGDRDTLCEIKGADIVPVSATEYKRRVLQTGAALSKLGVIDRVAILGETSAEWLTVFFAVAYGGGVCVPIDRELTAAQILNIINESGATCVIYSPAYHAVMDEIAGKNPYKKYYICTGDTENNENFIRLSTLTEGVTEKETDEFKQTQTHPDDVCSLLFTSGTTGKSKGVMLTQRNLLEAARGHTEMFTQGKTCLSALPIHHTYEFTVGILGSLLSGVTICINDNLRNYMKNLKRFSPENIYVVPAFIEMLYSKIREQVNGSPERLEAVIKNGAQDSEILNQISSILGGKLRLIVCGGAPLPAFYVNAFKNMGITLLQGYGITECSPLVSINPERQNVAGSIGKAISCCDVKITDPNEDGLGEIAVKGANVMKGYYNNPKATDEAITDGWFNTGDIGYIDKDGYIYITGRKKNIIVLSNGKNIYPEELEDLFSRIPYVKEAIIRGETDGGIETRLLAEFYIDPKMRASVEPAELNARLESDMADINRGLPFYMQVHAFKLRDDEFKKTTKKSIKRHAK